MRSTLAWVDFSDEQRDEMMSLIRQFRESDTLDELGLGHIRDAFSNYFFPGTSTLQTRAKYMLFVPWMYLQLEDERVPSHYVVERAREEQLALLDRLRKSDDIDGVIGISAGHSIRQLPSSIYWNGLRSWGLLLFDGSERDYHVVLSAYYRRLKRHQRMDGEARRDERLVRNWRDGIPDPPKGWPKKASIALRREEAQYLQERIVDRHPASLLLRMVDHGTPSLGLDGLWKHPAVTGVPSELKEQIENSRCFSLLLYGADILYNLLLASAHQQRMGVGGDDVNRFLEELSNWADDVSRHKRDLARWYEQHGEMRDWRALRDSNVPAATIQFAREWIELALKDLNPVSLGESADAERLIRRREDKVKGHRARLANPRALERWQAPRSARRLDYRWRTVRRIISDIVTGLSGGGGADA